MSRDRAAYMREYRARKRAPMTEYEMAMALTEKPGWTLVADEQFASMRAEIVNLTAEVDRLKRELAARPTRQQAGFDADPNVINTTEQLARTDAYLRDRSVPEFRPVPKPSQRK